MKNKLVHKSYFLFAFFLAAILCCLQNLSYADDITLKWAPNTESDLAGYKIYYKKGSSGMPYDGVDIDQGSSPIYLTIDDPNDPYYVDPDYPELLLTGLDENDDYFLVVTAIDNEEPYNESGFSNEVSTIESSGGGGSVSVSGGSSSSSSCFIASSSLSSETDCYENHFILSAYLIVVLIGLICGAIFSSTKTATSS